MKNRWQVSPEAGPALNVLYKLTFVYALIGGVGTGLMALTERQLGHVARSRISALVHISVWIWLLLVLWWTEQQSARLDAVPKTDLERQLRLPEERAILGRMLWAALAAAWAAMIGVWMIPWILGL